MAARAVAHGALPGSTPQAAMASPTIAALTVPAIPTSRVQDREAAQGAAAAVLLDKPGPARAHAPPIMAAPLAEAPVGRVHSSPARAPLHPTDTANHARVASTKPGLALVAAPPVPARVVLVPSWLELAIASPIDTALAVRAAPTSLGRVPAVVRLALVHAVLARIWWAVVAAAAIVDPALIALETHTSPGVVPADAPLAEAAVVTAALVPERPMLFAGVAPHHHAAVALRAIPSSTSAWPMAQLLV
eukprot:TRINITY_DN11660_c1_g10_i5.p4 TRINITY_DN11660_c1_g10~~TRINITY_DN11660_c1_g10_i5.p4  ORF type:complete len:247 (+),score=16.63 TRINITY_DN11660_c1_g10_i5:4135-4875(+)